MGDVNVYGVEEGGLRETVVFSDYPALDGASVGPLTYMGYIPTMPSGNTNKTETLGMGGLRVLKATSAQTDGTRS